MRSPALFVTVAMLSCVGMRQTWADLGPKPTIEITLPDELTEKITDGALLLCNKADCSDAKPLMEMGPQGFGCSITPQTSNSDHAYVASHQNSGSCVGMAYGFSPYLQLKLNLKSGKDIKSRVFTKKAFDAHFKASFTQDVLTVSEQ